jgi:hypothetical protein
VTESAGTAQCSRTGHYRREREIFQRHCKMRSTT